ncbi:MAG: carbohydrate ABC transporter permease [Anaerolineae bacterium]|nr:carbohydrate ABC transporter permease [Anaerolineae bacterium]MCA9887703.1 carbohydrate ABC transporter permease [Anaerolineae bacterium]MCA9892251.1 carbohydrate ABC transporter permease [Anaerolineae bacterium]MCB9459667.1 carbohydrate ABC transporter permease [Anaerolineaceae bacterium]
MKIGNYTLRWQMVLTILVLTVLCLVWIYPFLWMISASLKTQSEIFSSGLNLIPQEPQWQNYQRAWVDAQFSRYMINTVLITIGTVVLTIISTSLAGYVLGRYTFIGRRPFMALLAGTIFIPAGYTIIPTVDLANKLGLLNSLWGVILVMAGTGNVIHILLFSAYFSSLPKELEEAAVLDGAGFLTVFFRVMLPLAGPVVATVTILKFLGAWNNFFVPLVFTFSRPDLRTLSVGMFAFVGENETDWSGMAAAATISLIPVIIIFFVMQRRFVEGIAGAVKQ